MAKSDFSIDAKDFLKSLENYDNNVDIKLQEALVKCALGIEKDAKLNLTNQNAVDTGRLRMSLYTDVQSVKNYEVEIGTDLSKVGPKKRTKGPGVGTSVEYAPYVEFGTYKMAARPFLRPAYDKNIEKLNEKLKQILGGKSWI